MKPRTKLSVPVDKFPSIFQAEMFAISRCAEILKKSYYGERILILSDSQLLTKEAAATKPIEPEPFFAVGLLREKLRKEKRAYRNRRVS